MRIVGVEHRVSKTVKVEKAKQEDLIVSTRTDRDGNRDTAISVISTKNGRERVTRVRQIEITGIVITGIQTETVKEGIGRIIVTRVGITEDRTREVTGIPIVFPIVENVVKGGLKIGMKM